MREDKAFLVYDNICDVDGFKFITYKYCRISKLLRKEFKALK